MFSENIRRFKTRFPELVQILEPQIEKVREKLKQAEEKYAHADVSSQTENPEQTEILSSVFPFWNFLRSKSGGITATENGVFLHSSYNPQNESRRLFENGTNPNAAYLFAGIGLGYAPVEFSKLQKKNLIIIIEPDEFRLLASMCAADWSSIFSHSECVIITHSAPEQIIPLIEHLTPLEKIKVITRSSQTQHCEKWFETFFTLLERNKQKQNINNNTLEKFSSLWLRNSARNIHSFPSLHGISIYKNMLEKKYPSLVVAAGPTLEQTIPLLKEIQKRTVIIAADTALRILLKNGIQPDFVILIDPQYYAACHLAGLSAPKSVLITESSVHPSVLRFNCRKTVLCESLFPLGRYFEEILLPEKSFGKITAGGSVATSCWDFAKYIGSKDIYTAGLDLGYPDKKTHVKGSTFEENAYRASDRLNSAENSLCSILFSAQNEAASDYSGNPIITDSKMKMFAWWFESQLAKEKINTFSLSKQSLKIPGMQNAAPEDLLLLPDISAQKKAALENSENVPLCISPSDFSAAYKNLLDMLESLYAVSEKGLSLCKKIMSGTESRAEQTAKRSFSELSEIDSKILSSKAKDVASLVFPTERRLEQILREELSALNGEPKSEILLSIVRSKVIYSELLKSIAQYLKHLKNS